MKVEYESLLAFSLLFVEGWWAILAIAFVAVNGVCQGVLKCRSHDERLGFRQLLPSLARRHVVLMGG